MNEIFTAKLKLVSGPALELFSVDGREALSSLYAYSVVALGAPTLDVDFEKLLGAPAEVAVSDSQGAVRSYHGLVASAAYEGVVAKKLAYRLEIVPWLWMLTRSANLRVFQKKTVNDIIKAVVEPYGASIKFEVQGSQRKREYCVQYRESDFNFISRLMEEEGIFYFFRHTPGQHQMVLANLPAIHVNELGLSDLSFQGNDRERTLGTVVTHWRWSRQLQTGKISLRDHNFMVPGEGYAKDQAVSFKHPHAKIEAYDYPSGVPRPGDEPGDQSALTPEVAALAKQRLEALQAQRSAAEGSTNSLRLCTGARFNLKEHPVGGQNGEYIVHATHIRMRIAGYESGTDKASTHECDFSAFPSSVPFRPPRLTHKPRVQGPQTAIVVGPAGEEIHTDKYGRVKVQFFWDREGKKDASSSCFVRVAQSSAGKQWGVVMLPRIGQEVVVDFLEGDPDRPMVTGGVYNAENMPPYTLPDNQTVSTIKTNSSKGGGGFNELKFDDKKGSELLYLQAEKDRTELVKNDLKTDVNHDLTLTIKNDRTETVTEGKFDVTVKKGKHNLTVKDAITVTAQDKYTLDATSDVTIESKTKITLKVGSSTIVLEPAGIKIEAVQIEGTAKAKLAFKGALSNFEADGVVTVKGALVKVN